jgi:plastocyanin
LKSTRAKAAYSVEMLRFGAPLVAVAVVALAGPAAADTPTLQANVGPGFTISLKDASGADVTHLDPGAYTIHVVDQSEFHDFHLSGPGVDKATSVPNSGAEDWDVTFVNGTYKFVCDVHFTTLKGSFTVGTVPTPTPTPTRKLSGTVGPGAKISLARSTKAGKATITIRDLTKRDNFHFSGPGVNKKTGVAFKGTVKWTVTLKAGTYTFRSDAHKALKGTLKVTAAA